MASTGKKWAIGCGVGCGLMLLVTLMVGGGLFMAVRGVMKEADTIEESYETLEADYGQAEDYTPTVSGAIPPERMEIFLAVREAMAEPSEKFANIIYILDDDDGVEVEASGYEKLKAGLSLIPSMMGYLKTRNETLLEYGMGNGEYTYIYSLAFFGYLDKEVADGPSVKLTGEDRGDSGFSFEIEGEEQSREEREKEIRVYLHRLHLAFLNNQIDVAGEVPALISERETLVNNPRRLLWEEGLPGAVSASIAPYAGRLEPTYIPIMNLVEVGTVMPH